MTGCMKFCGCCDADCGCTNAVPKYYFTMAPDGSNSNIREVNDELTQEIADETKFEFAWKGGQRSITVDGKKMSLGDYANYMALRTSKKKKTVKESEELLSFSKYNKELTETFIPPTNPENIQDGLKQIDGIGGDVNKLINFMDMEMEDFSTNELDWQDIGEQGETKGYTEVKIDGKTKRIPITNFKKQEEDEDNYLGRGDEAQAEGDVTESLRPSHIIESFKDYSDDTPKYSYEFKDSPTHGLGSFSTRKINENEQVSLYYLNLLNENENAPQYQRTDFCRFTNHSQHIPNIMVMESCDGNFYTYALRDIEEGEELLIDYFHVFDTILPALKEEGEVIPEVLRWTDGYNDLEIPPDSFNDLRDELAYFNEINESVDALFDNQIDEKIKDKVRDKIDDFKFYTSSTQRKIRKRKKKNKKKERKYSRNILGLTDEVEFDKGNELEEGAGDASATASEADANRKAYLKQYGAKPEQRKRRSARTNARNKAIRAGKASVGDGKDLDHKDGNPMNNSPSNLRMVDRSFNRGRDNNKWRKTNEEHGAGEIGTEKLLKRYIKDTPFMKIIKDKNGK
jgi:hypothetical protein